MKIRYVILLALFLTCNAYALQPAPDPIPVYVTSGGTGGLLLTDQDYYVIAVCLAVLGAGWITFH